MRIHEIVKERRGVTADTAGRLAHYFGGDAASWLALQADYDLKTLATREDIARRVLPRESIRSPQGPVRQAQASGEHRGDERRHRAPRPLGVMIALAE